MHQSLFVFVEERVPRRITFPLNTTIILSLSKYTRHHVSHSTPMDMRALAGKLGKMRPRRASGGRDGRSKLQVWMDVTVSPFGMVTTRGLVGMCLFVYGVASLP